jgi:hypothetical protein
MHLHTSHPFVSFVSSYPLYIISATRPPAGFHALRARQRVSHTLRARQRVFIRYALAYRKQPSASAFGFEKSALHTRLPAGLPFATRQRVSHTPPARQRVFMRSAPASGFSCAPRPPAGFHALRAGIPKAGFDLCRRVRKGRLAYAAAGGVCFAVWFLGASPLRGVGLSAPIYFAALRKFRFNPLRLAPASGFICATRPPAGLHTLRVSIPEAAFSLCLRV